VKGLLLGIALLSAATGNDCDDKPDSDRAATDRQETILAEGNAKTGMPAITHFREKKLLKSILELRDQEGLTTFTYTYAENTGKRLFLCDSIGYGIPYATQYTAPMKEDIRGRGADPGPLAWLVVPQADPNGLFSPASAEGTWVMCKDPNGPDVKPVYIEPRVIVSPFKLDPDVVAPEPDQTDHHSALPGKPHP
jgi:hypothetical protein